MNPARPGPGVALCPLDALADPGAKSFRFRQGEALFAGFVIRKDGEVRGYVDSCPHAGWPLALIGDNYFTAQADFLICRTHGALFAPATGQCVAGPCVGRALEAWPVAVIEGMVATA